MCLIDDDGTLGFENKLLPVLNNYDLKCIFAIITNRIGDEKHLSWEQIEYYNSLGFDIISHSNDHTTDIWQFSKYNLLHNLNISDDDIINSCLISIDELNIHGINTNAIAYPYGTNIYKYKTICSNYFDYGLSTERTYIDPSQIYDSMSLPRVFINTSNISDYTSLIDKTVECNGMLILSVHSNTDEWSQEVLNQIFQYLDYNNIKFMTFSEAINYKTN